MTAATTPTSTSSAGDESESPADQPAAEPDRSVPRRLRPPRAVWLATALFALVCGLWTVAVPAFRAPDEAAHLDMVLYLAEGNPYPRYDGRYFGEAIGLDTQRHLVDPDFPWPRFDAAQALPRDARPDVDDLGGVTPDSGARPDPSRADYPYLFNQMPQHPPLFYWGMAGLLRFERWVLPGAERPSLDRELGLLRLANVALVAPLPLLAWATVMRLGGSGRAGVTAALLPLGLPQLTHIGSSLNNDNLLALLGAVLAVLLTSVARGRRSHRTDLAVGVVLGLALLTKAFALMFVPWVLVAYAVGAWTVRRPQEFAGGAIGAGVTAGLVGTWWWIGNWIRVGEPAPTTETIVRTVAQQPPGFEPDLLSFAWTFVGRLFSHTWVWIGYRNPKFELPALAVAALTLAALAATVVAARTAAPGRSADGGLRRLDVLVAWLPALFLVAFVFRRAWGLHQTTSHYAFIQGRYLFAALVPAMAIIGMGATRALGRWVVPAALGLVAVLQVWVLTEVVQGSWSGPGALGSLRGALAWSPWPPVLVLLVSVAAVATAAGLAWEARPTGEPSRLSPWTT